MFRVLAISPTAFALATGCASCATISNAGIDTREVHRGTRPNLAALRGDESAMRRFPAPPPARPVLDLPLSLMPDMALLSMTVPSATSEFLVE